MGTGTANTEIMVPPSPPLPDGSPGLPKVLVLYPIVGQEIALPVSLLTGPLSTLIITCGGVAVVVLQSDAFIPSVRR